MKAAVSVIICTRNRANDLRQTLVSIADCEVPLSLQCELVIVDNGSSDNTRKVVEVANFNNMPVRYVMEPRCGKGYAYNTGMSEARGNVFLFTDDDVRVPTNWIEGMCRRIVDGRADAVAGGVKFPQSVMDAMKRKGVYRLRGWFASTDGISADNPGRMVGANMAFSRRVLERVRGFDVRLGPGALGFYDETFFAARLLEERYRLVSAFDVAVEHHFDVERITRANVLSSAQKMGCCQAYLSWHWQHADLTWTAANQMRLRLGLCARRLLHPLHWLFRCTPTDVEIARVIQLAWRKQFSLERQLPRRYAKMRLPRSQQEVEAFR